MPTPEGYEQLLAYLQSQLPQPIDRHDDADGIRFLAGEPPEVLVTLTESIVVVEEFAGEWEKPAKFRLTPRRIGLLHWPHLPENELLNALAALIKGARAARHSRYQPCERCDKPTPPEWMHDAGLCQSCATDGGGLVH
jgi:hypothetical protein